MCNRLGIVVACLLLSTKRNVFLSTENERSQLLGISLRNSAHFHGFFEFFNFLNSGEKNSNYV